MGMVYCRVLRRDCGGSVAYDKKRRKKMKTKKKTPVSLENLNWRQLAPGMVFHIFRQNEPNPKNPEPFTEIWQFQVEEVLPSKKVAKVAVVFPVGYEEEGFFEEIETGGTLQVYFDPEKTGYFLDWNVIDILLWD